jgi:hypothetical protein
MHEKNSSESSCLSPFDHPVAACRGQDPDIFFIEGQFVVGSARYRQAVLRAKTFCDHCSMRQACLDYGMTQEIGIYGGTTSGQRRRMRGKSITIIQGELE